MFCKLLVLNFLNLLLNPQHFNLRKGWSVSTAQDKRKQVQPRAVLSHACLEQTEPLGVTINMKAGSFNKKARIRGPSDFQKQPPGDGAI